jgi:hypothetical protein
MGSRALPLNRDFPEMHVDKRNHGPGYIIGLGD